MGNYFKANPDDRSDNVEKLQEMVQNTIGNMHDAEEACEFGNEQDKANIEAKNQRRLNSIAAMRNEIQEEANYQGE
ncbi:small acid-soluble spore protein Tlp [Bacillus sp. 165]|uniref:small acid-soluble spore protein Tlp n=1 Tax=Bacillus sp. 165 TaxID=1529117 RepID=UPI001ADC8260|nr:small acid-soluble spore protein Tlp [Bacillus sp. 165]MBO9129055.1 small acid-soluble spore protein Tlp [Bacillus sp. 165]